MVSKTVQHRRNVHNNLSTVRNTQFKLIQWCCFCGSLALEFSPYEKQDKLFGNIVQLCTCSVHSLHFSSFVQVCLANCSFSAVRFFCALHHWFLSPDLHFPAPAPIVAHPAREPIDPLQMYMLAGLFAQAQASEPPSQTTLTSLHYLHVHLCQFLQHFYWTC